MTTDHDHALRRYRPAQRSARRSAARGALHAAIVAAMALAACDKGGEGHRAFDASKANLAKLAVDKWALELGARWAMTNPATECPDSLLAVAESLGLEREDTIDPWGTPYKLLCGAGHLPPGVRAGFAVLSAGQDRQEGTADDINSWTQLVVEGETIGRGSGASTH